MPKLQKSFHLEITVEQFLNACSPIELQEIDLRLDTYLRKAKADPKTGNGFVPIPMNAVLPIITGNMKAVPIESNLDDEVDQHPYMVSHSPNVDPSFLEHVIDILKGKPNKSNVPRMKNTPPPPQKEIIQIRRDESKPIVAGSNKDYKIHVPTPEAMKRAGKDESQVVRDGIWEIAIRVVEKFRGKQFENHDDLPEIDLMFELHSREARITYEKVYIGMVKIPDRPEVSGTYDLRFYPVEKYEHLFEDKASIFRPIANVDVRMKLPDRNEKFDL